MRRRAAIIVASILCCGSFLRSDDAEVEVAAPTAPTKAQLNSQIEKWQADEKLDPKEKQDAIELLKSALHDCDAVLDAQQRKLRLQRQLETAATELPTLRNKLATMPSKAVVKAAEQTAEALERRREELERLLDQPDTGLRERVSRLEQELGIRPERLTSAGDELSEAEEKLSTARDELRALPDDEKESAVPAAQRLVLQVAIHRWEEESSALELERDWLESTDADRWISVLKQIAEVEVTRTEDELEQVEQLLDTQRQREAAERVEQARHDAETIHPSLKPWAKTNEQLAERSQKLTQRLGAVDDETQEIEQQLETLEEDADGIRDMVQSAGRSDALGLMFRQELARLPDQRELTRRAARQAEEIRDINLKRFEIERQLRETPEAEAVAKPLEAVDEELMGAANGEMLRQAEAVLSQRTKLLDQLDDDYGRLFTRLVKLTQLERKLAAKSQQMAEFYHEQLLWVRSGSVFGPRELMHWASVPKWLANRELWPDLPAILLTDLEQRPAIYLFATIAVWAWLLLTRRRRPARDPRSGDFSLSAAAAAMVVTTLQSAFLPGLLAFAAWRIDHAAHGSAWLTGISNGLARCAIWAWPLMFIRKACAAHGLASEHLGWTPDAARRMKRCVSWFLPPSLILMFIVACAEAARNDVLSDSLGRSAFLVLMVLTGLYCRRLLRAGQQSLQIGVPSVWPVRMRQIAAWALPGLCWGLAGLAFAGFYDTALRLVWRLELTSWFGLGILGLQAAGSRWIQGELQRMETVPDAARAALDGERILGEKRKSIFARMRERQASRAPTARQVSRQMTVLLYTSLVAIGLAGSWAIWSDVVPQAENLDRWTVWQTISSHQIIERGADNTSDVKVVNRLERVTVVDLALAVLISGLTFVAARNIPGFVEILFLERLPLDTGGRFAVTILVRYALFVVGVSLACACINIGWANVQWLVAAASVGLGFGLQDIFANFVSGIILLFERPIRVGDVITIGDTTGTVSQIRFRSTNIVDADRRELVVPNRDLITGKLLNWTLSDQTNRITIRVVVPYNTDPSRVRQLLQEIALSQPAVLKEPPPTATLEEFGVNSLVFNLRVFLPSLDDRSKVNHELHSAIHARLHAEGISAPNVPPQPAPTPSKGVAA